MASRKKEPRITAAEWVAKLNADPEFVARAQARDEALRVREEEDARAQVALVVALRAISIDVRTVWDLVNTRRPYPQAVPVLIEHLMRPYPPGVREGIARALAVRESRAYWKELIEAFDQEVRDGDRDVSWGIACALAAAANKSVVDDVIRLVRDPQYGPHRMILCHALARVATPKALATLRDAAGDPQLEFEIRRILMRKDRK